MTTDELISLHSSQIYWVNMLGFLPGFLYLSGLRKSLYCPRKETPSIKINAGSVGIGGEQTGIYPVASPGGWNIIGQTPLKVFIPSSNHPALANPLDRIKFNPITLDEFKQLQSDEQGPQT